MNILFLILIVFLTATSSNANDKFIEEMGIGCGKAVPVKQYSFTVGKDEYVIPKDLIVIKNDKVIFSDAKPNDLREPFNGVMYFMFNDNIFLETFDDDCVDLLFRRIIYFSTKNDRFKQFNILTSHHEDVLFTYKNKLYYWSEWFCMDDYNNDSNGKGHYIFVFNDKSIEFTKLYFPEIKSCVPEYLQNAMKNNPIVYGKISKQP